MSITIFQYLEMIFPDNVYSFNPPNTPLEYDTSPKPYVVVEEDRDQLNTQLQGTKQLRDDYFAIYLYSNEDLALSFDLFNNIIKAKEVVRLHAGVERFITLQPASGCLRPIYRDDIKRYYAVIRFRVHHLI